VLCLSNRLLSQDMAKEMLEAWFDEVDTTPGREGVELMRALDARSRRVETT